MSTNFKDVNNLPIPITRMAGFTAPTSTTAFESIGDEYLDVNTQIWYKAVGKSLNAFNWVRITYQSLPTSATVVNVDNIVFDNECFPAAGSAPLASFINLANIATTAYTAAAYGGLVFNYVPEQTDTNLGITLAIPVSAIGYSNGSGGYYLLPPIQLAVYTAQSGDPIAVSAPIQFGYSSNVSTTVQVSLPVIPTTSYGAGLNLYVCAFFDSTSGATSSQVGVVLNGAINATTKLTVEEPLLITSASVVEYL